MRYSTSAAFVPALGRPLLDLLCAQPGERVLDLGCGNGAFSLAVAATQALVLGVDASAAMVDAARSRGVTAMVADGQALQDAVRDGSLGPAYRAPFDAVVSNAALHWMPRAADVLSGARSLLRPGGRFVAEFGGHGNVAAVRTALTAVLQARGLDPAGRDPWYFPSPAAYGQLLRQGGFEVATLELIPRPTPLPASMVDWLRTLATAWYSDLADAVQEEVLAEVSALLAPALREESGGWTADYVRLRVSAVRR